MNTTQKYLLLAALSSLAAVSICILLEPTVVFTHYGLSYYGNFRDTLFVYGIGLGMTAYFLMKACRSMQGTSAGDSFGRGLEGVSIALLGIVATPSLSPFGLVQDLHVGFGLTIFVAHFLMSSHYVTHRRRDNVNLTLLGLQFIAILVAAVSFPASGVISIMLPAQVLAIVSFGLLVLRATGTQAGTSTVGRAIHHSGDK